MPTWLRVARATRISKASAARAAGYLAGGGPGRPEALPRPKRILEGDSRWGARALALNPTWRFNQPARRRQRQTAPAVDGFNEEPCQVVMGHLVSGAGSFLALDHQAPEAQQHPLGG